VLHKKNEKLFSICPAPYPRDKTVSNNSPPPGPKGWTCPRACPGGGGMVTGKIEPRIAVESYVASKFLGDGTHLSLALSREDRI